MMWFNEKHKQNNRHQNNGNTSFEYLECYVLLSLHCYCSFRMIWSDHDEFPVNYFLSMSCLSPERNQVPHNTLKHCFTFKCYIFQHQQFCRKLTVENDLNVRKAATGRAETCNVLNGSRYISVVKCYSHICEGLYFCAFIYVFLMVQLLKICFWFNRLFVFLCVLLKKKWGNTYDLCTIISRHSYALYLINIVLCYKFYLVKVM